MRDLEAQQKWCEGQITNPTQGWDNLCQSFSRQSWGMPAYGSSARAAWHNVKDKYKVKITKPSDNEWWASVPRGAILYSDPGYGAGHAWVAAGDMTCFTNDYVRRNKIDRADIRLKGWNNIHQATVGYIIGAQYYEGDGFFRGLTTGLWDGKIPPYENLVAADEDRTLASAAAWRLACRLRDLGYGGAKWTPVKYEQTWPVKAMAEYNAKYEGMEDPTRYGPKMHERVWK